MPKRLLSMLAIGGVAVLCFAPNVVRAEEGATEWQRGPSGNVASNINIADAPIPALPAVQERQSTATVRVAESQASDPYRSLVNAISRNNSVDPDLIDAMIRTESNYNPWAISPKGARGLMQLIPETGRRFGVQDFFDPQQNIEGGVRYVKYLLNMFGGNIDLSLAAYNAGENLVARLGTIPPIPETRNYVRKIRSTYKKPSAETTSSIVTEALIKPSAPVASAANETLSSTKLPEKAQEPASAPISKWLDERGVHHFSNIESIH